MRWLPPTTSFTLTKPGSAQRFAARVRNFPFTGSSGDVPSLEAYFPRGSYQDPKHVTTTGCWPSSFLWG